MITGETPTVLQIVLQIVHQTKSAGFQYSRNRKAKCLPASLTAAFAGYRRFRSSGTVSIVSLVRHSSYENGITGYQRNYAFDKTTLVDEYSVLPRPDHGA